MVKKMLATVITVCMIIAMLPAGIAYGAENEVTLSYSEEGTGSPYSITYSLDTTIDGKNVATVTKYEDVAKKVTIPTTISSGGKTYTVTSIGKYAFLSSAIMEINFEENSELISIGDNAFQYCANLTSIEIPASVTSIGAQTFSKSGITKIKFNDNSQLTSIGGDAFFQCKGLESIKIPAKVELIAPSAFSDCGNLTKFEVDSDSKHFAVDDGVLFNKDKTILVKWPVGKKDTENTIITEYAIPQTVETIADRAFAYCKLETIVIPNSVTTIDTNAFINSEKLQKIIFDSKSNLTTIGDDAFFACKALTSFVIPKNVESIGSQVFAGCSALKIITIPKSVKNIDGEAFGSKPNLTTVIFEGTEDEWKNNFSSFPENIKSITPICVDATLTCEDTTDKSATLKATLEITSGGPLTEAKPQYRVKNGNDWSAWKNEAKITGLSPETEYTFEARYVDKAGNQITNPVQATATTAKKQPSSSSSRSTPIITVTGNDGGSVVYDRINRTITITPKEGYFVKEVSVGGEAVTVTEGTMVLENIYGWSRVAVSFEKIQEPTLAERVMDLELAVRTVKTKKGNVKVMVNQTEELQQFVKDAEAAGYKVYYKYCRSVKKSSKYIVRLTKAGTTYINTEGVKGKKYYYKVRVLLYDRNEGSFVSLAESNLKQCKYGTRTWSK